MSKVPVLGLVDFEEPEVGEPIDLELPTGKVVGLTWLGVVRNPKELGEAMRLMAALDAERKGEPVEEEAWEPV
jgi:hypothetical protein